jgi:hypothetical protein
VYSSADIVTSRQMRYYRYEEMINAYRILVGIPAGK